MTVDLGSLRYLALITFAISLYFSGFRQSGYSFLARSYYESKQTGT